jgi:hypothetical protein
MLQLAVQHIVAVAGAYALGSDDRLINMLMRTRHDERDIFQATHNMLKQ